MIILPFTEDIHDDKTCTTLTEVGPVMRQGGNVLRWDRNQTLPIVDGKLILTNQRHVSMQVTHSRQFRVRSARQAPGVNQGSVLETRKDNVLCLM